MTGRTTCAIILIMFAIEFINAQMIYNVTVGPDSKTRQAIPIDVGPCDATLNITPEAPWKLGSSHITSQDDNLWSPGSKVATMHTYNMVNAYSSQEYVHIYGKLTQNGSGEKPPPPFDVTVPAVDIDWVGYEAKTNEGALGQEVEYYNKVACQITTNHNAMREFIVRPPFDDYSMFQNTATLRMTFNSSLILVYDNLDNPVSSGQYLTFSKSASAKTFHMSPKDNATAGREFSITIEGAAGEDGSKARDDIMGVVVKVEVDITGFSRQYTYAMAPDCPVAKHQSTCQATIDPLGVSTIVYSIQGDAHGATIDPNTGVITPSTTKSGDITVRAAATVLTSCYDEKTFHIRARPIAVSQSIFTKYLPVGGKMIHTFSGTGGSLEYAEIKETVIEVNWPFRRDGFSSGMSTFLDAGGTMLKYDYLQELGENFDINDFLPFPPKAGLPQEGIDSQEWDWICPMCGACRDIEQGVTNITFTLLADIFSPTGYLVKITTGYSTSGEPVEFIYNGPSLQ